MNPPAAATQGAMNAAQLKQQGRGPMAEPPPLDPERLETLSEEDIAQLLVRRFRAFSEHGLHAEAALMLAVTPDQ